MFSYLRTFSSKYLEINQTTYNTKHMYKLMKHNLISKKEFLNLKGGVTPSSNDFYFNERTSKIPRSKRSSFETKVWFTDNVTIKLAVYCVINEASNFSYLNCLHNSVIIQEGSQRCEWLLGPVVELEMQHPLLHACVQRWRVPECCQRGRALPLLSTDFQSVS